MTERDRSSAGQEPRVTPARGNPGGTTSDGAFLDQACSDPAVRSEVESLLIADEQASGFLELPLPALDGDARIGRYRLLRKLGEGETSSVYLAARDDNQIASRSRSSSSGRAWTRDRSSSASTRSGRSWPA